MSDASRTTLALQMVRIGVAGVLGIHGYARAIAGGVAPFGGFLEATGFPAGVVLAWAITIFEMAASLCLAAGRGVRIVAPGFIGILAMGILLVHRSAGWFVVGLGRNGSELSVLLIVCLVALMVSTPGRVRTAG
ncbi:MAG: DoxX family protein [Myxococcales bacterium]|nr:DoxX family protein [Myxococcales bacterium]